MPLYREGTTGFEVTPDADLVKMAIKLKKVTPVYTAEKEAAAPDLP